MIFGVKNNVILFCLVFISFNCHSFVSFSQEKKQKTQTNAKNIQIQNQKETGKYENEKVHERPRDPDR